MKYLRRNCVLSSPYRQSEGFCTVSVRVPSAAIKCSFGAEETRRHIHNKVLSTDPLIEFDTVSLYDSDLKRGSSCRTRCFLNSCFSCFFHGQLKAGLMKLCPRSIYSDVSVTLRSRVEKTSSEM